ncbi:MAG: hypothetical protein WA666_10085 [Nitrospirota bacterium]
MRAHKASRFIAALLILLFSFAAGMEGTALRNTSVKSGQVSIVSLDVCGHGAHSINPAGGEAALFHDVNYFYYPIVAGFPPSPDETSAEAMPGEIYVPPKA